MKLIRPTTRSGRPFWPTKERFVVCASDAELDACWGVDQIDADQSWSAWTGKGVKVGVIDTGIASHPDLSISGGVSYVTGASSYKDDNGHGTHVAGTIAARKDGTGVVGVAPEASLYAIKVLNSSGSGYLSWIIAGIDWAISNDMDVINMSLGSSSGTTSFQSAVDRAYAAGIVVVAAAGNRGTVSGTEDSVSYPARYNSVIAVAATYGNNNRASFSSTGSSVEISAPGVSVRSTVLNSGYAAYSGASMAAPPCNGHPCTAQTSLPDIECG